MTIELTERQLMIIRFAVANEGNKLKGEAERHKLQRDLHQAAKDMRLAEEFLSIESYLHDTMRK